MLQLDIDCEGPITQNDNAFELCREFIPDGDRFFSIVSKYDDFLADVEKRQGYKAGDTLKLVLPFMKAFGVTDKIMEKFSRETIQMLPGTELMLPEVNAMMPSFIISTSYRPYIDALCTALGFPAENCFCTNVNLDQYSLPKKERNYLIRTAAEIAGMEMIEWPDNATGLDDVQPAHRKTIERLNAIFWHDIPGMEIGRIFQDVNPVGGAEKAIALQKSLERTGLDLKDVIYAGDSITDVQALELVNSGRGVAISFNGNRYAINAARWAVLSTNTAVIAGLCKLMLEKGTGIMDQIPVDRDGELDTGIMLDEMEAAGVHAKILKAIADITGKGEFQVFKVSECPRDKVIAMSEKVRKSVRGHGIGELG